MLKYLNYYLHNSLSRYLITRCIYIIQGIVDSIVEIYVQFCYLIKLITIPFYLNSELSCRVGSRKYQLLSMRVVIRKCIVNEINEHERLSNCTQIKVKDGLFYFCSTFHNHKRNVNDEHILYPKMSVKLPPSPQPAVECYSLFLYFC